MEKVSRQAKKRWAILLVVAACVLSFLIGLVIGLFSGGSSSNGGASGDPGTQHAAMKVLASLTSEGDETFSQRLMEEIMPKNILDNLRYMSSEPHIAASQREHELADWVHRKWMDYGADHVEKVPYRVLLSYPDRSNPNKASILDQSGNKVFETSGFEKKLSPDQNHSEVVPPFNAFAPAGTATADLVYANYARVNDFERLLRLGVNCSGKMVIARYGKIYRGNKLRLAAEYGAVGLILYSDPADYVAEGATQVFPQTWWLPGTGVQRGSTSLIKGDQLTQGYPATEYAYRTPMGEWKARDQLPIPCQPIGYDDAMEFLRRMGGPKAPSEWQGRLNVTYRLGPGFAGAESGRQVRLEVHNREEMKTIYNVVGRIDGAIEPDRYVIIGGHRDSWMFGSVDALSSQSGLIEIARAFCALKRKGWRPRRSLIFISWAAEEYGMVGSIEWVEEHWKMLQDRTVAYLNADTTLSGNYTLLAYASPVLRDIFKKTTKKVKDPEDPLKSVYDTWAVRYPERPNMATPKPLIKIPGSGTDHAGFIFFAGIQSTYHKFIPDPALRISAYPLYHSVYETFQLINLVDPKGKVLTAGAQIWAELARSLIDSYILPLNVYETASFITDYVEQAEYLYFNKLGPKGITFDALYSAARNLTSAAERFEASLSNLDKTKSSFDYSPLRVRMANDKMMKLERMFLDYNGQPDRPTLRHIIYAPSSKNNYAGSVFSGLADLLYDIDKANDPSSLWIKVKQHFAAIIHSIQSAADFLDQP